MPISSSFFSFSFPFSFFPVLLLLSTPGDREIVNERERDGDQGRERAHTERDAKRQRDRQETEGDWKIERVMLSEREWEREKQRVEEERTCGSVPEEQEATSGFGLLTCGRRCDFWRLEAVLRRVSGKKGSSSFRGEFSGEFFDGFGRRMISDEIFSKPCSFRKKLVY
jgi:hypothetical protein